MTREETDKLVSQLGIAGQRYGTLPHCVISQMITIEKPTRARGQTTIKSSLSPG